MAEGVPLVDLGWQNAQVRDEVAHRWQRILTDGDFILGRDVTEFETRFSEFTGVPHCIGVANGTDALELLLRAHRIGPGDEVIVPANSFIATALAVTRTGASLRLVDVTADHWLLDPATARAAISPRTAAVVPVHLYGQLADLPALTELARTHGLLVCEDAAQAQGARQHGSHPGTGTAGAATSFYPGKNLGALGDAGAVLVEDGTVAADLRGLRNYGSREKYIHDSVGFNSRLDTLQAAVLLAKTDRLAEWNAQRVSRAERYRTALAGQPDLLLPGTASGNSHVWHLFVIHVADRDRVLADLRRAGIQGGIHYPRSIHRQEAFASLGLPEGSLPVAEWSARHCLSLPLYPGMTDSQQDHVIDALTLALAEGPELPRLDLNQ